MEIKTLLLFLIITCFSTRIITSKAESHRHNSNIAWWCSKTPHPKPCTYFMTNNPHRFRPHHLHQFRKMTVQVAADRAITALAQLKGFGQVRDLESLSSIRHAWSDCVKLYADTIRQLNRTLHAFSPENPGSDFDAQTWLSSALTNVHTCESGSMDLNVSDYFSPVLSNNLTQLVSNSLAINSMFMRHRGKMTEHNVTTMHWLSEQDRRLLAAAASPKSRANVVVGQDGSGDYKTVQAAVDAAARRSGRERFIIYVKKGVYRENIAVGANNVNVMLVGDGMTNSIITASRSVKGGFTTFTTATAAIDGQGFIARDITFRNTAGPTKGQAVALRSASDLSVFYRCAIQGYQDTLFVHSQRQFYRECYIYGTIDFIFGNAAAILQNCFIYVRRPLRGQSNIITAQGRGDPYQNTAIVIQSSRILPANDLQPVVKSFSTYLGRPWQQYSRTVVMGSYIDGLVHPQGWSRWGDSNFGLNTLYYGEFNNSGVGASGKSRVRWKGFHWIGQSEAASFTAKSLLAGGSWLPATGVPFTLGL